MAFAANTGGGGLPEFFTAVSQSDVDSVVC